MDGSDAGLLTPKQVARQADCTVRTLRYWRENGFKLGARRVRVPGKQGPGVLRYPAHAVRGTQTLSRCAGYSPGGLEDAPWWLYLEGYESPRYHALDLQELNRSVRDAGRSVLAAVERQIREEYGELPAGATIEYSAVNWWVKDRFDESDRAYRNRTKRERTVTVGVTGMVLGQLPIWREMAANLGYSEPLSMPIEESALLRDLLRGTGWPLPEAEPEKSGVTLEEGLQTANLYTLLDEPVPWSEARRFLSLLHDAAWMAPGDDEERRTVDGYRAWQRDIYRMGPLGALLSFKYYATMTKLAKTKMAERAQGAPVVT